MCVPEVYSHEIVCVEDSVVFYQETNYVTLLIFWLLIDVCFLLLHVSFVFDCLVYFFYFHYSVLRVRFYNKIIMSCRFIAPPVGSGLGLIDVCS